MKRAEEKEKKYCGIFPHTMLEFNDYEVARVIMDQLQSICREYGELTMNELKRHIGLWPTCEDKNWGVKYYDITDENKFEVVMKTVNSGDVYYRIKLPKITYLD